MKQFVLTIAISALMVLAPSVRADEPGDVKSISWERNEGKLEGGPDQITLYPDGRSQIMLLRRGELKRTRPGWTVLQSGFWNLYITFPPIPEAEGKAKFEAAIAAGIEQLKGFDGDYFAGPSATFTVERWQISDHSPPSETIVVPPFQGPGQNDGNIGSANHKRYLAVANILNDFDTDAFEERAGEAAAADDRLSVDMIRWCRMANMDYQSLTVWADGRSEIEVALAGKALPPNPGWTIAHSKGLAIYRQTNPLAAAEAKQRFAAAIDSGIENLRTVREWSWCGYRGTSVQVQLHGKVLDVMIPDTSGSSYHGPPRSDYLQRFTVVKKAFGDFNTDAYERPED